jgi:RimJ/RimL family protein N-acetyltransferase
MVRLLTPRLVIRSFTTDDAEPMFRVLGDSEVMRFIPGGPDPSIEVVRERLARAVARERDGQGVWAIERASDGAVIGSAGIVPVDWRGPEIEIAYKIARPAWGNGYATEAASACLAHAFRGLGLRRVIGLTFPANVTSQRVLEKVGMRALGPTERYYGMTLLEYASVR